MAIVSFRQVLEAGAVSPHPSAFQPSLGADFLGYSSKENSFGSLFMAGSYHKEVGKPFRMLAAEEGREIWGEDSWDWSWQEEGYETQNGTSGQDLDIKRP